MTGAADGVDSRVRVARMNENLLVLLEPTVDGVPLKGDVPGERSQVAGGLGVVPCDVLLDATSSL